MELLPRFSMQSTLSILYTSAGTENRVAEIEERAIAILTGLGIGDYRITGITMDHSTYSTSTLEAQVEFNMIGDFKE
jgi:hypothetical protein